MVYIYHERQTTESALCGVHCLNTLLQRPVFSEVDLARIAQDLDEHERVIMSAEGHDTKEFLKFMGEDSINVGDDGNFSIQVLAKALQSRNIDCIPLTSKNYYNVVCSLKDENAFIINKGSHWFTIRKIVEGEWYNFNSLMEKPEHMPESHLGSYLDDFFDKKGVFIYRIKGELPHISPDERPKGESGRWVVAEGSDPDELELKAAIEASKRLVSATKKELEKKSDSSVNYPKLDSVDSKINYPKLESPSAGRKDSAYPSIPSQPLPPVSISLPVNTKDMTVQEHTRWLMDYFGRTFSTMEKLEQRLTSVEQAFAQLQARD